MTEDQSPAPAMPVPALPVPAMPAQAAPAQAVSEPSPEPAAPKVPLRSRLGRLKWLWWSLAGVSAAGLLGLSAYLVWVTAAWQEQVAQLTTITEDLRQTAAQDRADTEAAEARLATVQTQLDTANARITDLANEEANATDHEDLLFGYMEAMIQCADARKDMIDVLTDSTLYYPQGNGAVKREINAGCDEITTAYNKFKSDAGK